LGIFLGAIQFFHTHKKKKKKTYKEVTSKFPLLSPEQRIPLHTEKQGLPSQLLNTLGSPTPFLNASKASAAKKRQPLKKTLELVQSFSGFVRTGGNTCSETEANRVRAAAALWWEDLMGLC
jgi:hypothetical protein